MTTFHSDHAPLQLSSVVKSRIYKSLFRYEIMWSCDPRFAELFQKQWVALEPDLNIIEKLERLKQPICQWNKRCFGDVSRNIEGIRRKLEAVRKLPRTDDMVAKEVALTKEMDE
ncbi:hypothetical protein QQ045_008338 [Rhodiola kirilowii]